MIKTRVLTAMLAIPIILMILGHPSSWLFFSLSFCLSILALFEIKNITAEKSKKYSFDLLPLTPLLIPILSMNLNIRTENALAALWISFMIGLLCLIQLNRGSKHSFFKAGAGLWIVTPLALCVLIHTFYGKTSREWWHAAPLLLVLLPIWAGDTAAIFAGAKFGKTPLAPKISPGKTKEGAIANFAASLIMSLWVGMLLGISPLVSGTAGIFAGVLGQIGDLLESKLKRQFEVKDSGQFLPGHGGILDRLDSFALSAMPIGTLILLALA